jgi:hypothetical protein
MMQKSTTWIAGVLTVGLLSGPVGALAPSQHSHEANSSPRLELMLEQGRKWPTDETLRASMRQIRQDMTASMPAIEAGRFSQAEYAALADLLESQVGHIVANCALPPEADMQLHILLASMIEGIEGMKHDPEPAAAHQVMQALDAYGRHFEDPEWLGGR